MKKINIIGRGRGKNDGLAADGEKFTCNYFTPGVDIIFNMHKPEDSSEDFRRKDHMEMTRRAGIKIIDLENYPIEEIQSKFKTKFFSNTVCYMIAYALFRGYQKINLWGCNIRPGRDDEPIVKNHPGIEFWLGVATGMGVDYTVNGDSMILSLKDGRYGYDR